MVPYTCCGVLAAALTFNKFACHNFLKSFGVRVADSIQLHKGNVISDDIVVEKLGLPCFIKPISNSDTFEVSSVGNVIFSVKLRQPSTSHIYHMLFLNTWQQHGLISQYDSAHLLHY